MIHKLSTKFTKNSQLVHKKFSLLIFRLLTHTEVRRHRVGKNTEDLTSAADPVDSEERKYRVPTIGWLQIHI